MLLGIDVGGTHTDAVLVTLEGIIASAKVRTDHDNLLASVQAALDQVLRDGPDGSVARLNLSTTLTTNAIVEGKTEEVGVLVAAGPGISPDNHVIGGSFHVLGGAIDHRGSEISPLDQAGLRDAVQACAKAGVRAYACVSKFSTRNPAHELAMRQALTDQADVLTLGHEISGRLGFPRRIATAYYNSAVWRLFGRFADQVQASVSRLGPSVQVNVLKADGGTMPLSHARRYPVESILSGPAASVMGILALCDVCEDAIILDVGGTTTDIAIFVQGAPLIEQDGISIGSYPTLVRALKTTSIGIGGDSALGVLGEAVRVGPSRLGPSLADGGIHPTLIDAFNVLGLIDYGDARASHRGIGEFAAGHSILPATLAEKAIEFATRRIKEACDEVVAEVNDKPVYTIYELLKGRVVRPRRVHVMGGPAEAMAPVLAKALSLPVQVSPMPGVANAVGAALARTTVNVELFADTQKGMVLIPKLGRARQVPRSYTLQEAEVEARETLVAFMRESGAKASEIEPEIVEKSVFNMVADTVLTGRNIRVRCQAKPGIQSDYAQGVRRSCCMP